MIDQELIGEVVRTIVTRFHPRRIVLFGSHARGDAGPDSDLDLMIEMDTTLRPIDRAVAVGSLFLDRDWPFDVVVYTPEEIERDRKRFGSLLTTSTSPKQCGTRTYRPRRTELHENARLLS